MRRRQLAQSFFYFLFCINYTVEDDEGALLAAEATLAEVLGVADARHSDGCDVAREAHEHLRCRAT
jgi:hypothetical protein